MSNHGVPHEAGHTEETAAKKVGLLAAVLAIGLTLVTILSHRSHTHAIMSRSEANDLWAYYQSKRIKFHNLELGLDLMSVQAARGEAREKEKESGQAERRAFRFDLAEGLFEIGLVMSSLFFLAHRRIFPLIGFLGGLAGTALGIFGLLS